MRNILLAMIVTILLSGCQTLTGAWSKKSSIAFKKDSGGSLSVWNADMSAAVAYKSGQICMQRALAVKTLDTNSSLNISNAILSLAQSTQNPSSDKGDLAKITTSLKETASLLTTTTERTAFLDIGMFYLCQMSVNGSLTDQQTAELIYTITLAGANMNRNHASTTKPADMKISSGENKSTP